MNKSELIDAIAKHADISKAAAGRALDATVERSRVAEERVTSSRWSVSARSTWASALRAQGRNPRTGATIKIRAAKVPKFRAGKALKDAVN